MRGRRAVFLDRDGVLNLLVRRDGKWGSPRSAAEFQLFPEVAQAVRELRASGMLIFVISNQPDVARGRLPRAELDHMTAILQRTVVADEVRICTHDDQDGCDCRKPRPGMLLELAETWGVDLASSYVIGDTWRDMQAGRSAGCRTIFLDRSGGVAGIDADHRVGTLLDAAAYIGGPQHTD